MLTIAEWYASRIGRVALLVTAGAIVATGCADPSDGPDGGPVDATAIDSSTHDANTPDASTIDSGMRDTGIVDASDAAVRDSGIDRSTLVIGTYRPGPDTTGPLPGTVLRRHDGDYVITTANAVVDGLDIYGNLVIETNGSNARVRNCVIHGKGTEIVGTSAVQGRGSDLRGLVLEDSTIDMTGRENWFYNGVNGANVTIRRVEITRTVDGIGMVARAGNVTVEGCWIHDGYFATWTAGTPNAPGHSDLATHNDAIQFHRGQNIVIRGNYLGGVRNTSARGAGDDFDTSCLMVQQEVSSLPEDHLGNVLIEQNWILGGAAAVNLPYKFGNDLSTVTIRRNRFIRQTWSPPSFYILRQQAIRATVVENVMDDTGAPVTISNGG